MVKRGESTRNYNYHGEKSPDTRLSSYRSASTYFTICTILRDSVLRRRQLIDCLLLHTVLIFTVIIFNFQSSFRYLTGIDFFYQLSQVNQLQSTLLLADTDGTRRQRSA